MVVVVIVMISKIMISDNNNNNFNADNTNLFSPRLTISTQYPSGSRAKANPFMRPDNNDSDDYYVQ